MYVTYSIPVNISRLIFCFKIHSDTDWTKLNFNYFFSALFVTLYTAIERLLACGDETESSMESALARCVLLRDLCPALHAIMLDGMKPEVITSFGRMPTSVWQVVEAVTRQVSL